MYIRSLFVHGDVWVGRATSGFSLEHLVGDVIPTLRIFSVESGDTPDGCRYYQLIDGLWWPKTDSRKLEELDRYDDRMRCDERWNDRRIGNLWDLIGVSIAVSDFNHIALNIGGAIWSPRSRTLELLEHVEEAGTKARRLELRFEGADAILHNTNNRKAEIMPGRVRLTA